MGFRDRKKAPKPPMVLYVPPQAERTHIYRVINSTLYSSNELGKNTAEIAANYWAAMGWRVVGALGHTSLIMERPLGVVHPNDDTITAQIRKEA